DLPREVEAVFREFRTCELSTVARDGTPITWPTLPFWQPERTRFTITTSIGLAQKALNVRRDPRVSLLFSDPTASGLSRPVAVLVQGDALAPDEVVTSVADFKRELRLGR
ncbi:MAG TPA: pyridoxamine 5'-phosphate oxidase family protein, partial [Actinomycetes bacterium]